MRSVPLVVPLHGLHCGCKVAAVPRTAGQSTKVTCDLFVLEFLQDREYDEWIQGMRPYVSEQFPCDTTGI